MKLTLNHYDDNWIKLKASKQLSIMLRRGITPSTYRKFIAANNEWLIHYSKIKELVSLGRKCYEVVDYSELPMVWQMMAAGANQSTPQSNNKNPYLVLYLLSSAPFEVVKSVYKTLAAMYHPDAQSGDADMFRQVTEAYQEIKEKIS